MTYLFRLKDIFQLSWNLISAVDNSMIRIYILIWLKWRFYWHSIAHFNTMKYVFKFNFCLLIDERDSFGFSFSFHSFSNMWNALELIYTCLSYEACNTLWIFECYSFHLFSRFNLIIVIDSQLGNDTQYCFKSHTFKTVTQKSDSIIDSNEQSHWYWSVLMVWIQVITLRFKCAWIVKWMNLQNQTTLSLS